MAALMFDARYRRTRYGSDEPETAGAHSPDTMRKTVGEV
jgi:hypothetical protein